MKIKTAAVISPGKVEIRELETPELSGAEILVKVHAVALCTLEQRIFSGEVKMPLPCTGGHELSGEIVQLGPDANSAIWSIGDRVAVRLLYNCGECIPCRSGRTNICEKSRRKPVRKGLLPGPGGLCDYVIVSGRDLFKINDDVSYAEASLTEPLACVVHSIRRAGIQLADDVVVIGGGIMGQLHTILSSKRGARVIMCEINHERCQMALRSGASFAVESSSEECLSQVKMLTEGRGAAVVINTTPSPEIFADALEMLAPGGTLIQYSSLHPDVPVPIHPQLIHDKDLTIMGSISPAVEDFNTANKLINSHIVDCNSFISEQYPFEKASEAFESAASGGKFRIIITD